MGHVALYLRISKRTKDGLIESNSAQERQGREYAATAWPGQPIVVYAEDPISAADDDKWRPWFEKLREAIRAGEVAHIWCVAQDRLQRVEIGWFVLAAELVAASIDEVHTRNDGILRVADDISGIKAVLAAGEIRKLKMRINNRLADNAAQGVAPGSRPFGYRHGVKTEGGKSCKTYVVVPGEAEAIRWAADRVLTGWSLQSIAAELRGRGVKGAHRVKDADGSPAVDAGGNPVTGMIAAGSVRSWLTKPTVAGWRVHRGVVVGRGNWEPILPEDVWQACRAKLSEQRTVQRADGGTYPVTARHTGYSGRKYTLTGGLIVCGVCGAAMVGSVKQLKGGSQRGGRDVAYYLCHPSRGGGGCTGIMLDATEQHVVDELFGELDKPEFLDAITADDHAARRDEITTALSALGGKRKELAGLWATGALTSDEWKAARGGLDDTERELRAELTEKAAPPARVNIAEARESWPSMDLGEQRAFLRLFIERVTIQRATPGRKGFDPGRVEITWRRQS